MLVGRVSPTEEARPDELHSDVCRHWNDLWPLREQRPRQGLRTARRASLTVSAATGELIITTSGHVSDDAVVSAVVEAATPPAATDPRLAVLTRQVGYAVCRCGAFECGVAAVVIVGVEEVGEGRDAFALAGVGAGVGPFLLQGAVEPLDLAVGLRPVGAGPLVLDPVLGQQVPEHPRAVAGPVVGHHPLGGDADGVEVL